MCKGSLTSHLAERRGTIDAFLATSVERLFPREARDRMGAHVREMRELAGFEVSRKRPIDND